MSCTLALSAVLHLQVLSVRSTTLLRKSPNLSWGGTRECVRVKMCACVYTRVRACVLGARGGKRRSIQALRHARNWG